jgi:hypothetical protein
MGHFVRVFFIVGRFLRGDFGRDKMEKIVVEFEVRS